VLEPGPRTRLVRERTCEGRATRVEIAEEFNGTLQNRGSERGAIHSNSTSLFLDSLDFQGS